MLTLNYVYGKILSMKDETLNKLVEHGTIISYEYLNLDEEGNVGESKFRNTEQVKLVFPNGKSLTIDTFCSGCNENTSLSFSV